MESSKHTDNACHTLSQSYFGPLTKHYLERPMLKFRDRNSDGYIIVPELLSDGFIVAPESFITSPALFPRQSLSVLSKKFFEKEKATFENMQLKLLH